MSVGIVEPVPDALHLLLRRAVLDLADGERRRQFAPVLHVGHAGRVGRRRSIPATAPARPTRCGPTSSRRWCAARIADRSRRWSGSPGPGCLDIQDLDLHWLAAAAAGRG